MFETAELGRTVSKEDFDQAVPELRTTLLEVQRQLGEKPGFSVVIMVNGMEGAGKGEVINLLNEWMDCREIDTLGFDKPTEEEAHRPPFWRYWMAMPPSGRVGVFVRAYYRDPVRQRVAGKTTQAELDGAISRINAFEKTQAESGTLFIKLWLHISKKVQKKRFKKLESSKDSRWRVTSEDWYQAKHYDEFSRTWQCVVRETSTGEAPWFVVDAADRRYRNLTIGQHIADRIKRHLEETAIEGPKGKPLKEIEDPQTILDTLDLTLSLPKKEYRQKLEHFQGKLALLAREAREKNVGVTLVFEGVDAAGKGGAIRRIIPALDNRQVRVIRIAAPTEEERAHHYLWRFWRHLPRLGRFTIYDRSWYGRVLVERIEGFATENEWMRSYKEINDFEKQLVDHGIVLIKFWVHISSDEQLTRFQAREQTPWKQYKITDEDYRNRDKANLYEAAANDMIERTGTEYAPWTMIEAENKPYGRIRVLETICDRLGAAVAQAGTRKKKSGK